MTRRLAAVWRARTRDLPVATLAGSIVLALSVAGPATAATEPAPEPPPDWAVPTESASALPASVVDDVSKGEHAKVVSVLESPAGPVYAAEPVVGRQDAVVAVRDAQAQPGLIAVGVDEPVHALATTDPLIADQWAFGVMSTTRAWQTSTGLGVVVAVVDSGVSGSHPDLAGALVAGYNARQDRGDYSSPASDGNGHGTHVAGIIAARAGNGVGGAGVAPGASIMPVKALDESGAGWVSDVAEGITWAVDHGARVVNLSLGSDNSSLVDPAIGYALAADVTVVAAAGNDGRSVARYPAATPGVISVGALDSDETKAGFSNYGSTLDLVAPGVDIVSTVPGGYASYDGTSMASPQVAGVAALVRAVVPSGDLTGLLTSTARDLGQSGRDDVYGYGLVDPAAALAAACTAVGCGVPATQEPAPAPVAEPVLTIKSQTLRVPVRVKVGHRKALPAKTRQAVPVGQWRSHTKRKCVVMKTGSATYAFGRRRGTCRLTFSAPAKDQYEALNGSALLRVTK